MSSEICSQNLPWHPAKPLFPHFTQDTAKALRLLPQALQEVRPLKKNHLKALPSDIRDLSEILTSRRCEMRHPYWNVSRYVSAYLYYFLPWNLIRLCRLFSGLRLPIPKDAADKPPLLLDSASGPLTLPLALWLANPEWRDLPVRILATDRHKYPLTLGAKLFQTFADLLGYPPWEIHIAQNAISTAVEIPKSLQDCSPWLFTCANALNELLQGRRHGTHGHEAPEDSVDEDNNAADETLTRVFAGQNKWPLRLFVEPGTRLGGTTIMALRELAAEHGLYPLAPCTHTKPCPLLQTAPDGRKLGWCHFTFAADDAPKWLTKLSASAGLNKSSLSLSLLLLSAQKPAPAAASHLDTRIISQAFPLPGQPCPARYGCAAIGLALLKNSANCLSGSMVTAKRPEHIKKDAKSGAIELVPLTNQTPKENKTASSASKKNKWKN